jgi:hypothetical protein
MFRQLFAFTAGSGVGERWYVSCFQRAFLIFSNRQILWEIQYPQISQN